MSEDIAKSNSQSIKELIAMTEFFKTAPEGVEVRIEISPEDQRQLDEELEAIRHAQAVSMASLQHIVVG